MQKKIVAMIEAIALLAITVLTGCGQQQTAEHHYNIGAKTDRSTCVYNLTMEPTTLDPARNSNVFGRRVLVNIFEGLCNLDENDMPVGGASTSWEISPDGLEYIFRLRENAEWSDGKPVTANDFAYAWKRALSPSLAADSAYMLYPIKNAKNINRSEMQPDELGVEVIDDFTLKVTLESPTSYFLGLTAYPIYFPVREDAISANPDKWAFSPKTQITNGKYKMTAWTPKASIILEKSETYWDRENVKLPKVDIRFIEDMTSGYASFKAGEIDIQEVIPPTEIDKAFEEGWVQVSPYISTYYYSVNVSPQAELVDKKAADALKNPLVRKALNNAIDRTLLTQYVTKGGRTPASSFVPYGVNNSDGTEFNEKVYFMPQGDVALAKAQLAEAGFPDGKGFPMVTLIYDNASYHSLLAQAIQDMWKRNLGIDIKLEICEPKVLLQVRNDKDFLLARNGWAGDYLDASTFLDIFVSNAGAQNSPGFSNPEYDAIVAAYRNEADPSKRDALLHKAEDILMEELPIIPIFYDCIARAVKPYVKGLRSSALGSVYFDRVEINVE